MPESKSSQARNVLRIAAKTKDICVELKTPTWPTSAHCMTIQMRYAPHDND